MAESKIRDDNYYQVTGWMLNRLGLKGTALPVYAIIYGFTQDGESEFKGSLQYLMDFTNASKPTVIKALQSLTENGLILKTENPVNGVKFNTYKANLQVVKNLYRGSKETLPGGSQIFLPGGSKETLPNNKSLDNKEDKESAPTYGEFKNVILSDEELDKLKTKFPDDWQDRIERLSLYIGQSGKKYQSHYATICNWARRDKEKGNEQPAPRTGGRKEIVPNWMNKDREQTFDNRMAKDLAWLEEFDRKQKTAGNDPELAARADALRQQFQGESRP